MPGTNIKQVEAAERSKIVKVKSYRIDLDLTTGAENFRVKTTVTFTGLKPGATTFIDCVGKRVISAKLNGADFDPKFDGETVFLPALAADNVLEIEHEGIYSNSGEGLHRFVDPVDGEVYVYTQFEVPDSRRMFAVFEQPDLKATFEFRVTAPAHWQVVSNQPTPAPVEAGEGLLLSEPPHAGATSPDRGNLIRLGRIPDKIRDGVGKLWEAEIGRPVFIENVQRAALSCCKMRSVWARFDALDHAASGFPFLSSPANLAVESTCRQIAMKPSRGPISHSVSREFLNDPGGGIRDKDVAGRRRDG